MPHKAKHSLQKVVYKPDSMSTDEYIMIVNGEEYVKWRNGDKSIPLIDVVDSFDVFHTGQGSQGMLGRPSKQQLETIFGTSKDTEVAMQVLDKGQLQTVDEPQKYSTKNDANSGRNVVSLGAREGPLQGGR